MVSWCVVSSSSDILHDQPTWLWQEFSDTLQPAHWDHFFPYARRVRVLTYAPDPFPPHRLAPSVFSDLLRIRLARNVQILPGLHTLMWFSQHSEDLLDSCVLMHKHVRKFVGLIPFSTDSLTPEGEVEVEGNGEMAMCKAFLRHMSVWMPGLTEIDLRMRIAMRHVEKDVSALLQALPDLRHVSLPSYCFTSAIVSTLSELAHVGIVQFQYGLDRGVGDVRDVLVFAPVLKEGHFLRCMICR